MRGGSGRGAPRPRTGAPLARGCPPPFFWQLSSRGYPSTGDFRPERPHGHERKGNLAHAAVPEPKPGGLYPNGGPFVAPQPTCNGLYPRRQKPRGLHPNSDPFKPQRRLRFSWPSTGHFRPGRPHGHERNGNFAHAAVPEPKPGGLYPNGGPFVAPQPTSNGLYPPRQKPGGLHPNGDHFKP